jgi:hypothetical protein
MKIQKPPVDWLLEGESWIEYRTRRDLLGESEQAPQVKAARSSMLADPRVKGLLEELSAWPGKVISSHKSAGQPFHKLTFMADLGFSIHDPGVDRIAQSIMAHQSTEGPFQLPVNIPVHYGGSGHEQWAWALCDAPLLVYALVKFGLGSAPQVKAAAQHLVRLVRANGWPCAVSKELGNFRGPGRKDDPCPYATLIMLKLLSVVHEYHDSEASRIGTDTLLSLWDESITKHPYMFYMGTDFRKLKAPFIWYDLLHVLDVLSRFQWVREDAHFLDMLEVMKAKAGEDGRFTPESVWTAWKGWEFAQKKEPSRWLTLLAWRILARVANT